MMTSTNDTDTRFSLLELDLPKPEPKSRPAKDYSEGVLRREADTQWHRAVRSINVALYTAARLPRVTTPTLIPVTVAQPVSAMDAVLGVAAVSDMIGAMATLPKPRQLVSWEGFALVKLFGTMSSLPRPRLAQVISLESLANDRSNRIVAAGENLGTVGALFSWQGDGEAMLTNMTDVANRCNVSPPTSKRLSAYFGEACRAENSVHYVARQVRGQAAYRVHRLDPNAGTGDSAGPVVLTVVLDKDGELRFESNGSQVMFDRIDIRYNRLRNNEILKPADVTSWVRSVLRNEYHAVRVPYGWHVPSEHVESARLFCDSVRGYWGASWGLGLPVVTSGELLDSIANGLADEVAAEIAGLKAQRKAAAKKLDKQGKPRDIGLRAAVNMIERLTEIAERTRAYAKLIGSDRVRVVHREAKALIESLRPLVNDTAQRGALVWEEIARG